MRPHLVMFLKDGLAIFAFVFKLHSVSLTPAKWMNVGKDSFQHFILDFVQSGTNLCFHLLHIQRQTGPPFIPVFFQVPIGLGHVRTLWAHEYLSVARNLVGSPSQIVLALVVV